MSNKIENVYNALMSAYCAASEAAEAEINRIEVIEGTSLYDLPTTNLAIYLKKNGQIVRFFMEKGLREDSRFRIDQSFIEWSNSHKTYKLVVEYSFHVRHEKRIVESALRAIKHVLDSVENVEIL